jgi:hypothetical protein
MADKTIETIERLEQLAAWHRVIAERAGSAWVWEARLLAAEDLERQAAVARARLQSGGTLARRKGGFDACSRTAVHLRDCDHQSPHGGGRLEQP